MARRNRKPERVLTHLRAPKKQAGVGISGHVPTLGFPMCPCSYMMYSSNSCVLTLGHMYVHYIGTWTHWVLRFLYWGSCLPLPFGNWFCLGLCLILYCRPAFVSGMPWCQVRVISEGVEYTFSQRLGNAHDLCSLYPYLGAYLCTIEVLGPSGHLLLKRILYIRQFHGIKGFLGLAGFEPVSEVL